MIIVKLGGSVITRKRKPLTINRKAMTQLAATLKECNSPLVIIHGAGSFGHYTANRFNITQSKGRRKPEGIAKTRDSVLYLNLFLTKALHEASLYIYSFPPITLYDGGRIRPQAETTIKNIVRMDLIPLTFGDVILRPDGFQIISGDVITRDLALLLKPSRVIFVSDVDGIFEKPQEKSSLLSDLDQRMFENLSFSKGTNDVTGGMEGKVIEAMRIARKGIDVFFTNGFKREPLMKALKGENDGGTMIRGLKHEN